MTRMHTSAGVIHLKNFLSAFLGNFWGILMFDFLNFLKFHFTIHWNVSRKDDSLWPRNRVFLAVVNPRMTLFSYIWFWPEYWIKKIAKAAFQRIFSHPCIEWNGHAFLIDNKRFLCNAADITTVSEESVHTVTE